jgi:hypothetical protein
MGKLKGNFENVFKNPGVVFTPLKCFHKWFLGKEELEWRKKELVVVQMTLVITRVYPGSINPCSHITPVWDGA